jgi:hypothetical protein
MIVKGNKTLVGADTDLYITGIREFKVRERAWGSVVVKALRY